MAVEFSRWALLSLLLSLWLSIFNLNCSSNWLEGQQGGTLLVGCALPHGSQCAGSPLPLKKHFCCNAEISPCIRRRLFPQFSLPLLVMTVYTRGGLKKAFCKIIFVVTIHNSILMLFSLCNYACRLRCLRERPRQLAQTLWRYALLTFLTTNVAFILQAHSCTVE